MGAQIEYQGNRVPIVRPRVFSIQIEYNFVSPPPGTIEVITDLSGPVYGAVPFDVLLQTPAALTVDIAISVSLDAGNTFAPATLLSGASLTGLPTTGIGVIYSFVWLSDQDVINAPNDAVVLRVEMLAPPQVAGIQLDTPTSVAKPVASKPPKNIFIEKLDPTIQAVKTTPPLVAAGASKTYVVHGSGLAKKDVFGELAIRTVGFQSDACLQVFSAPSLVISDTLINLQGIVLVNPGVYILLFLDVDSFVIAKTSTTIVVS